MSNVCRFTGQASRDIESIIDFIADSSSFDTAERFLSGYRDLDVLFLDRDDD